MGKEIRITWPDQSNATLNSFILTGVHAECMHSACTPVKIEFLKYGLIFVKIVCSACNLKVQLICDLPDPLPYAGFFL